MALKWSKYYMKLTPDNDAEAALIYRYIRRVYKYT